MSIHTNATRWLVLALAAGTHVVAAQTPTREVRGRVFEAADSTRPVVGAEVELLGTAVRTNNTGSFWLPAVALGEHELRVRRLGFKNTTKSVRLSPDGDIVVNVALQRSAAELTEVVIEGRKVWVPPRLGEVYERAARGWGKLFTEDDIRQQNPSDLKALLNTLPAVQTNDRGITFQRCQAGLEALNAVSDRLSGGGSGNRRGFARHPGRVQVYVDGMRMTSYSSSGSDENREDADKILKAINPSSVAAMEIYTGASRLPTQFHSDACAAIAIWTKSY